MIRENKSEDEWEKYIQKQNEKNFQSSQKFKKVIQETYKNSYPLYLESYEKERIKAIFPFIIVKSKIFKTRAISLPFIEETGIMGEYTSQDIKEIIKICKEKKVDKIEIRTNKFHPQYEHQEKEFLKAGLIKNKNKYEMIAKLTNAEDMWKRFHKHTRNDIRKAEKNNVVVKPIEDTKEINEFYKLYFQNMKHFGTPQHSKLFFTNIYKYMNDNILGLNCYVDNKLIGSIIVFYEGKKAYVAFNVSKESHRHLRPNDILYWNAIKKLINKKIQYLNIGEVNIESKNTREKGLYKFKSKWLGEVYPKVYFTYPGEKNVEEKKGKLKKLRKIWRKIPTPIIRIIGPKICSQLGM
jgi:lipid II:glycine glycyltransferase (peptidoglycan interpeptide bridge formation enzyme)